MSPKLLKLKASTYKTLIKLSIMTNVLSTIKLTEHHYNQLSESLITLETLSLYTNPFKITTDCLVDRHKNNSKFLHFLNSKIYVYQVFQDLRTDLKPAKLPTSEV